LLALAYGLAEIVPASASPRAGAGFCAISQGLRLGLTNRAGLGVASGWGRFLLYSQGLRLGLTNRADLGFASGWGRFLLYSQGLRLGLIGRAGLAALALGRVLALSAESQHCTNRTALLRWLTRLLLTCGFQNETGPACARIGFIDPR